MSTVGFTVKIFVFFFFVLKPQVTLKFIYMIFSKNDILYPAKMIYNHDRLFPSFAPIIPTGTQVNGIGAFVHGIFCPALVLTDFLRQNA